MADAVNQVLSGEMTPIGGKLSTSYAEIDLPFAKLPTREALTSQAASSDKYQAARARLLLTQIDGGQPLSSTYPYPVQAWRLGDGPVWITLGGEVVVDFALRLKQELPNDRVWIAAYTNDVMAYIPSRRVLMEGGYEGGRCDDFLWAAHHLGSRGRRPNHPRSRSTGRQAMTVRAARDGG